MFYAASPVRLGAPLSVPGILNSLFHAVRIKKFCRQEESRAWILLAQNVPLSIESVLILFSGKFVYFTKRQTCCHNNDIVRNFCA